MRRPDFKFETVARATLIFLVMIFVAAAMSMASKNPPAAHSATTKSSTDVDSSTNADPSPAAPMPVTITGCLEQKDDAFRLKNTQGDDAPKARSWKSGFLKKGPSPVAVVDASNRLKLSNHVGERVTVTGVLNDREMKVRSLHKVAAACS